MVDLISEQSNHLGLIQSSFILLLVPYLEYCDHRTMIDALGYS